MLDFLLSEDAGSDRLIVDTQSTSNLKLNDSTNGYYSGEANIKNAYGLRLTGTSKSNNKGYSDVEKGAYKSTAQSSANSRKAYNWETRI